MPAFIAAPPKEFASPLLPSILYNPSQPSRWQLLDHVTRTNESRMGQVMNKLKGKDEVDMKDKQKKELDLLIEEYFKKHYEDFEKTTKGWDKASFYHAVYDVFEKLGEKKGAVQYILPTVEELQEAFKKAPKGGLSKEDFKKIVSGFITYERFRFGQGSRDILLCMLGFPIVALLIKKALPGPTASISDEVFIPIATSGAVIYLAKTNRL